MKPYQVIVARVTRGPTLASALADFERRAAEAQRNQKKPAVFEKYMTLSVPNMDWEITHDFQEMMGQPITGPKLLDGMAVTRSHQMIRFKLDRTGASVSSLADVSSALNGHHPPGDFIFDQPFLLIMRKRDHTQPFFVLWVENAELLQRK
jgi:hypothetical protein